MARLSFRGDEDALDIGCGDGKVTARLASMLGSGSVIGLDSSPEMIEVARSRYPDLGFILADASRLRYRGRFDLVVSFTALHWITDRQGHLLAGVLRALRPGGRFAAQFPGVGNAAGLLDATERVLARPLYRPYFEEFQFPWLFAAPAEYAAIARSAGFDVGRCELVERDVHHRGVDGLTGWIEASFRPHLARVPENLRGRLAFDIATAYANGAQRRDTETLHVPGIRLEIEASRPV